MFPSHDPTGHYKAERSKARSGSSQSLLIYLSNPHRKGTIVKMNKDTYESELFVSVFNDIMMILVNIENVNTDEYRKGLLYNAIRNIFDCKVYELRPVFLENEGVELVDVELTSLIDLLGIKEDAI